jgi:hypothetical protein
VLLGEQGNRWPGCDLHSDRGTRRAKQYLPVPIRRLADKDRRKQRAEGIKDRRRNSRLKPISVIHHGRIILPLDELLRVVQRLDRFTAYCKEREHRGRRDYDHNHYNDHNDNYNHIFFHDNIDLDDYYKSHIDELDHVDDNVIYEHYFYHNVDEQHPYLVYDNYFEHYYNDKHQYFYDNHEVIHYINYVYYYVIDYDTTAMHDARELSIMR